MKFKEFTWDDEVRKGGKHSAICRRQLTLGIHTLIEFKLFLCYVLELKLVWKRKSRLTSLFSLRSTFSNYHIQSVQIASNFIYTQVNSYIPVPFGERENERVQILLSLDLPLFIFVEYSYSFHLGNYLIPSNEDPDEITQWG